MFRIPLKRLFSKALTPSSYLRDLLFEISHFRRRWKRVFCDLWEEPGDVCMSHKYARTAFNILTTRNFPDAHLIFSFKLILCVVVFQI